MYFFSLNRVALTSACFCATLLAAGAVKDPLFTKVFDGTLISAVDYGTEAGIFGNRMIVSFGGYILDSIVQAITYYCQREPH